MERRVSGADKPSGISGAAEDPSRGVSEDVVRQQLERLLASTAFRYSERLSRFLRFAVEQQLAGNTEQLKETVLAIEIFDREPSYDSRVDSIVRVEARRLRQKLVGYYETEGRDDAVIITLPKGSYVPAITLRAGASADAAPAIPWRRRHWRKGVVAAACALVVIAAVALLPWADLGRPAPARAIERLTSDSGLTFQPALSNDGKLLAFSSDRGGTGALDIWVQQVPRGTPVRLTDHPGDDIEPSFSPDGTLIAYRADGELDGIYTVPALGGNSTLVARGGYRPRFSPDGRRIAFWTGERTFRTAKVFIVPLSGGEPVQIAPAFLYGAYPIWSPDGRHVIFVGAKAMVTGDPSIDDWDWWAAPVDGGTPIRMEARKVCEAQGLRPPEVGWAHRRVAPYLFAPSGEIVFSARLGDQMNIWSMRVSGRHWQARGPAQQLTFGAGRQDHPGMSADAALVFSALTQKSDIWILPVEADAAQVRGSISRLTTDPSDSTRPAISRDGKRIAFVSNRSGSNEVWVKDIASGRETALTQSGKEISSVVITPDGSRVGFGHAPPLSQAILAAPFTGGAAVQLCSDCGEPRAWRPAGDGLVFQRTSPPAHSAIGLVLASGETRPLISSPDSSLYSPSVSADGKWITLIVRKPPDDHRVMVVPVRGDNVAPAPEWISVTKPGAWVDKPRWSPNGAVIYYVSNRDGFVCIWAQRLDPAAKTPVGEPKAITHFHGGRMSLQSVFALDLSVAEDKLAVNIGENNGNVWLAAAGP